MRIAVRKKQGERMESLSCRELMILGGQGKFQCAGEIYQSLREKTTSWAGLGGWVVEEFSFEC